MARLSAAIAILLKMLPAGHVGAMAERLIDAQFQKSPLPVLRAARALRGMAAGREAAGAGDGPGRRLADFRDFCRQTGHALIATSESRGVYSFSIKCRARRHERRAVHPSGVLAHDTGPEHPECPDRVRAVLRALEAPEFSTLLREVAPLRRSRRCSAAHSAAHVEDILALPAGPGDA